jgi:hypothetical protein
MLCGKHQFQGVNADAPPGASGKHGQASAKIPPRRSTPSQIRLLQQNRPFAARAKPSKIRQF